MPAVKGRPLDDAELDIPATIYPSTNPRSLHRILFTSHSSHFIRHVLRSLPPLALQRSFSRSKRFTRSSPIHSKVIYSNKAWCVVEQWIFSLREINQMKCEMSSYLEWVLNVKPEELAEFEAEAKRDYETGGAQATIPTPSVTSSPAQIPTVRSTASAVPIAPAPRSMSTTGRQPSTSTTHRRSPSHLYLPIPTHRQPLLNLGRHQPLMCLPPAALECRLAFASRVSRPCPRESRQTESGCPYQGLGRAHPWTANLPLCDTSGVVALPAICVVVVVHCSCPALTLHSLSKELTWVPPTPTMENQTSRIKETPKPHGQHHQWSVSPSPPVVTLTCGEEFDTPLNHILADP